MSTHALALAANTARNAGGLTLVHKLDKIYLAACEARNQQQTQLYSDVYWEPQLSALLKVGKQVWRGNRTLVNLEMVRIHATDATQEMFIQDIGYTGSCG